MCHAIRFILNLSGFAHKRSVDHVLYITPTRVIGASQWKCCSGLYMVWHDPLSLATDSGYVFLFSRIYIYIPKKNKNYLDLEKILSSG